MPGPGIRENQDLCVRDAFLSWTLHFYVTEDSVYVGPFKNIFFSGVILFLQSIYLFFKIYFLKMGVPTLTISHFLQGAGED